ncbi:MAG: hypothetical protein QOH24_1011 [Verrucomicrobiota bacterium]
MTGPDARIASKTVCGRGSSGTIGAEDCAKSDVALAGAKSSQKKNFMPKQPLR